MNLIHILLLIAAIYFLRKPLRRLIWHSVRYLLWHPKAVMLLVVAFLCYNTYGIWTAPDEPDIVPPPPEASTVMQAPPSEKKEKKVRRIPISYPDTLPPYPSALKNGNSRFASDLLTRMTPEERQWYSRIFYHALETLPSGQTHQWMYQMGKNQMFGRITPGATEIQDNGLSCRHFKEILAVDTQAQTLHGLACQRAKGGWCKLRQSSARTCEIQPLTGMEAMWYNAKRSIRRLF